MKIYGLLGFPLSHSFSKSFFREKFEKEGISDCRYENFSVENIEKAVAYLKNLKKLSGFNITIPHKRNIMKFLDEASPVCRKIQSCNCVKITNGVWSGHNTDITGFSESISPLLKPLHARALVFGTGGASRAITYALEELGVQYQLVSRKPSREVMTYDDLTPEIIHTHHILINTTPVGQFPDIEKAIPIPYEGITSMHLAYDLIYNPEETLFLKKAKSQGATVVNGKEMLIIQAEESWRIWNDENIPVNN